MFLYVYTVFLSASLSCRNFVGYNSKEVVRDHSNVCPNSVSIVRELRDTSLFVKGFGF